MKHSTIKMKRSIQMEISAIVKISIIIMV